MNAIEIVNEILLSGIKYKASDIHIEKNGKYSLVKFRIEGILYGYKKFEDVHEKLIARIKILSNLDTTKKLNPQDGSFSISIKDNKIDIRTSILPLITGEKAYLRILDPKRSKKDLEDLFSKEELGIVESKLLRKNGMILVTGPTGSGKTTTLYSFLNRINTGRENIITVEDPVEYKIQGINQIEVNSKRGLSFENSLRSILRSDPDVIMIGEIRDKETAEIAVRSSITGHLILSTLHTYSSFSSIIRLMDMGVEDYLIASSLSLVINQRLIGSLCPYCKSSYSPSDKEKSILEKYQIDANLLYKNVGCEKCIGGYTKREAVFELLEFDRDYIKCIGARELENTYKRIYKEKGSKTLLEKALEKVKSGEFFLKDVLKEAYGLEEL